ncbi:MAG: excalibur calcium-binding domain-containing protein, partial [Dichotomicrobium sp.]
KVCVMRKFVFAMMIAVVVFVPPLAAQPEETQMPSQTQELSPDCSRSAVTCGALDSCAEACGFLRQCGLSELDRDDDGIPCESMCSAKCDARG